jgi:uncharacterized protein YdeI (BOF family)
MAAQLRLIVAVVAALCGCHKMRGGGFTMSTANDTTALAMEANALAGEISARLDDPEYDFRDGSGPACVIQLTQLADKCNARGLQTAARRLEQLARDVATRSE